MKKVTMESLVTVPESIVKAAWEAVEKDESSGFAIVLKAAEEFRAAEMTPVFVLDQTTMQIYCFAKETMGKKLH